ncbi:MAG: transposase [Bacteroidota bacterium]|nr:transposase [Bacteroidota bacterium]
MLYENRKKKSCWGCKSSNVILWGKQKGKQRFHCKNCDLFFTRDNPGVKNSNRFPWFKDWVIGRQTLSQIRKASGYSERSLKRYFSEYLSIPPILSVKPSERVNLLIDGTYFRNDLCLIIYRDDHIKFTQLYRITNGEKYVEIREDLANLLELGVKIESITCDGHRSLLKAIKKECKHVIVQRCLVHIQRMCRIWLSSHPKSRAGYELKKIVGVLHKIKTQDDWGFWIVSLVKWHEEYAPFINEKSYNLQTGRYWYKHKQVRRSFTTIKRALPNMFQYLKNERIPKTTNGLESFFGHLKSHLVVHRGLSINHRKSFIKWYLFFRNQK